MKKKKQDPDLSALILKEDQLFDLSASEIITRLNEAKNKNELFKYLQIPQPNGF
jgi:hypothetical protein